MNTDRILYHIAHLFSVAFHPLMMPIYSMIYILYFNPLWSMLPSHYKTVTMVYVSGGTSLLPLLALATMIYFGLVGNPEMPNKSERILPLAVSCLFVALTCYFTHTKVELPLPMARLIEGMFVMLLAAVIVTPIWKISLHAMGVGALLTFICLVGFGSKIDFSNEAIIALLITGIVGWARLYMRSHTPLQLAAGMVVGICSMTCALMHY